MLDAIALPAIHFRRVPPPAVGLAMPPTHTIGGELRQALPVATVEALDGLVAQTQAQILDPLLYATSVEQLTRTFEQLYPKFWNHSFSLILTLWAAVEEDPQRFFVLTTPGFEESQDILRERGPRLIGQDATLAALFGLHTITRVSQAATKLLEPKPVLAVQLNEDLAKEWQEWIIAYGMAVSGVLFSLISGKRLRGRRDNIVHLAYWSKTYAVKVYDLTKRLGLLQPMAPPGPLPEASDEEDLLLAEAGLDDYRQLLEEEEEA